VFSIADRFEMRELPSSSRKWVLKYPLNENQDPILIRKSLTDFEMEIAHRFIRNFFLLAIVIAIQKPDPGLQITFCKK